MSWTVRKTVPSLDCSDLERARAFYERLGFRCGWTWPREAPERAGLVRGECELQLCLRSEVRPTEVYLVVDDVAACHAEMLAGRAWELLGEHGTGEGAGAPAEPAPAAYGYLEFDLVDPWGHRLSFGQRLER